jgi:hypothetical protein
MENILFYSFSTIAATFGSAVGIIVAAAVFRMQKIDQIAIGLATELMTYHSVETERIRLYRIIIVQDWKRFLEVWDEYHGAGHPENNYEQNHRWLLERVHRRLERIRNWTRWLVYITLGLIGFCFVGLATTYCIRHYMVGDFAWHAIATFNLPVFIATIVAVVVLVIYGILIWLLTLPNDYGEM